MKKPKITESESLYKDLEQMEVAEILFSMNDEDARVSKAVRRAIPAIELVTKALVEKLEDGGRLIYIGTGTSGRLGILDAAELRPTFGVPEGLATGIIAGGDKAIRSAVEAAEDDPDAAARDLAAIQFDQKDFLIGISASGSTPYVLGGIEYAKKTGAANAALVCNPESPLHEAADTVIEVITGPEFVTGSTRLKAGTATKMVLNMISTAAMIRLGHVKGSKMIDMQLNNAKLHDRGIRMLTEIFSISESRADEVLKAQGSVRKAIDFLRNER